MSDNTPTPWEFPLYAMSPEHVAEAKAVGLDVPRFAHNDGAVNIMAGSGDDRTVVAHVICQTPYKRGEGYRTVCETRDANAEFIVRAVNSYDEMLAVLKEGETLIAGDLVGAEWKRACSDFLSKARAAIAKAEARARIGEPSR